MVGNIGFWVTALFLPVWYMVNIGVSIFSLGIGLKVLHFGGFLGVWVQVGFSILVWR